MDNTYLTLWWVGSPSTGPRRPSYRVVFRACARQPQVEDHRRPVRLRQRRTAAYPPQGTLPRRRLRLVLPLSSPPLTGLRPWVARPDGRPARLTKPPTRLGPSCSAACVPAFRRRGPRDPCTATRPLGTDSSNSAVIASCQHARSLLRLPQWRCFCSQNWRRPSLTRSSRRRWRRSTGLMY